MRTDTLGFIALLFLGLLLGLGDVTPSSPLSTIHLLLPLTLLLALIDSVRSHRWPAFPRELSRPVALWLAVSLASATTAPQHQTEALASLEQPASGALLLWAVYAICTTPRRATSLGVATALGGCLVAVLGLAQASGNSLVDDWLTTLHAGSVPIGDVPRIASTLSHPNLAAIVLELSLPLMLAWTWTAHRAWRPLLAVASTACLLALTLTFSRAGIIACLFSLALVAALCCVVRQRRPATRLGLVTLVVPLALLWTWSADPGLDRRLTAGLDESSALSPSRLEYWSIAVRMLHDHPLLGVGPDNYRWDFAAYSGVQIDHLGVHAHNQYLETLADTGVLGLLALLVLIGVLARIATRHLADSPRELIPWRLCVAGSLSAWLVHALLDDFDHFWPANVLFWLVAGLAVRFAAFKRPQQQEQAFGRVALRDEIDAGPHRREPVLGSTAQRNYAALRADTSQSLEVARRTAGQIPIEEHHVSAATHDVLHQ